MCGPRRQTARIPEDATVDQVDDYHGTKVADPYRWLEDLDSLRPLRGQGPERRDVRLPQENPRARQDRQRLTKLWDYEKFGLPGKEANRYFYTRNAGLQNQAVLY